MSLFSGIGNIFHSIGSFFTGGDDEEQKKKQQQQQPFYQAPQKAATFNQPSAAPAQNNQPQQPPDPFINLFQGGNTGLKKAQPPAPAPAPTPPPQPSDTPAPQPGGFFHDITHNPVTNVVGDVVKPLAKAGYQFGNALVHTPQAVYREVQNKPINDIQQNVFGTSDSGTIAKDILGDTATLGLTAAAPGLDNLAESGISRALPTLGENLVKAGAGAATGGVVNTGYGAANQLEQGANPGEILRKAPENFAIGAATGGVLPGVLGGVRKVTSNLLSKYVGRAVDESLPNPDELATGVKSANPMQGADAAKIHSQAVNPQELSHFTTPENAASIQENGFNVQPTKAAQGDGAYFFNGDKNLGGPNMAQGDTRVGASLDPNAKILDLSAPDYNGPSPTSGNKLKEFALANGYDGVTDGSQTAIYNTDKLTVNPTETPAAATPVEKQPTPVSSPAAEPNAPNPDLKNARYTQAVADSLGDPAMKQTILSEAPTKDNASYGELYDTAQQKVGKMTLPEVVANYGKTAPDGSTAIPSTPGQYYEYLHAVDSLSKAGTSPEIQDALTNALYSANEFATDKGYGLGATKLAYDKLPTPMKVAYINKLVVKGGGKLGQADMERLYSAAELQGKFAAAAQEAESAVHDLATKASEETPGFNDQMKQLLATEREAQSNLYDQNRTVVDILEQNLPKSDLGTRVAQNARTMMLSSVGGRVFALTGTGFNVVNHLTDKSLSAGFGKAINAVTGSNAVKTSIPRPGTLLKGAVTGAKGLVKEVYGKGPVKSVEEHLQKPYDNEYSHDTTRYGTVGNALGGLRKAVRVGVGSHLALTKGVETSELEQAARQTAKDINVPKENLQGYVDYYKAHPPKNVAEEAKQVWLGVNNLHKNGVSGALSKVADAIETAGGKATGKTGGLYQGVAKQIRTVAIPFSHYMGGFVNKALTDRNVFYNAYRIAAARSPQELSDQLAHLTSNVGMAGGLGYLLAKNGTITDKDQDGKSYDGLYFHIGDKYIGVAWAGQAAMPIIMGARLQMDGSKGKLAAWPNNIVDDLLKATGVAGTFGDTSSVGSLVSGDSGRGAPQIAGSAVRQHIPGFLGDVNAELNQTSLDPTHEKPLTKATSLNKATGRQITDVAKTELNKTKAVIPGLSQKLPRQAGEAAPTELDRMLHAGEASQTQKDKAVADKKQVDLSTYDKQNNIPDPAKGAYAGTNDSYATALEAAVERGDFDKASQGVQQELDQIKNDNNVAQSTKDKLSNKIKQFQVAKSGKLNFSDMKLYNGTSVSEWRQLGNPKSDTYDPETYQRLWNIDEALAKQGVAGGFLIGDSKTEPSDKQKYSAKAPGTGRGSGRSSANRATDLIKSNTIGSLTELPKITFGNLAPVKIANMKMPTIQQIPANQLIKKRTISVSRTR